MHRHYPWVSLLCAVSALIPVPALAQITADPNGTGTQITQTGQQFDISGGTTSRNGHNLFHLFREFGLNTGQTANFLSTPRIRNILAGVNGGNASYINGLIQVSGGTSNLYLLNPAGIVFGSNARLNVPAAFHASTASRVHFEGGIFDLFSQRNDYANLVGNPTGFEFNSKGILINEGHLSVREGQSLTLMAHQVINTGTLSAPGGTVTVQAVPETGMVRLSQEGMLLSLEIPQDGVRGEIAAVELPRLLTGGTPEQRVNSVLQNPDGTISLVHDPNRVSLPMQGATAVIGGRIDVAHATGMGGNVNVLGRNIAVVGATINASGNTGGGTILVGGDYLGGTTETSRLDSSFNAQNLFVDANSVLNADAITNGNGGTVINWADNSTQFHGTITARGGALGGDGGFVETSGRELLGVSGIVDASAPRGNPGLWLLDPRNVTINSTSTTGGSFSGGIFTPTANNATVLNTTINTALDAGTSVTITTGNTGFQIGNITVNAPISKTAGGDATLTLAAANSIFVNADIISTSNKLNIVLNADTNNILGGAIIVNGVTLDSNGGNITLGGGDDPLNNPAIGTLSNVSGIELNGATLTAGAGNITLRGQGRNAVIANSHGIRINNSTLENTSGNITLAGEGGNRLLGLIDNNSGISISNSQIRSDSGLISLDGTGGSSLTGANNSGVILTDSTIANNEGNISITGQAGNALLGTLNNNVGIIVSGSNIENQQGNIELLGFGGNSLLGASNIGIYINNNSQISNNEGYIYLSGIGGASLTNLVTNNDGVHIAGSDISNISGTIEISGEGGISLLGSNNVGLRLLNSTLENESGDIDLSGTGGESSTGNTGIFQEGATVKTTSGDIFYEAEGTGAATGLIVVNNSFIGDGTGGDIDLVADTMELDGVTIQGSSHLTIQPLTRNTPIVIGDDATGSLSLNSTELNNIADGFSLITIGRADGTGLITVEDVTFTDNVLLRNPDGGGINLTGNINMGANTLSLDSGGDISQTGFISTQGLVIQGSGNTTLTNPNNQIERLAANTTGNLTFTDTDGFEITGLTAPTAILSAGGPITQSSPMTVKNLAILGTGDTELTDPNNQIERLAANTTGNLTVVNSGTLTVDTVNPNGIERANTVFLQSMGGNIVLNQPISASGNITLVAAQNFINNVGSAPLVVGSGNRWLVYATSPQGNVNGWSVMGGSEAFGLSYPQSPSFSGSGFVYTSAAPPAPPIPPDPINPVPPPNPINPPSPDPINPVIPPEPIIPVPPDDSRFESELGREFVGQKSLDVITAEALCDFAGEEDITKVENIDAEVILLPECKQAY